MILHIDHIGIAVKDLAKQGALYTEIFGLEEGTAEVVQGQMVKTIMYRIGNVAIELLEAISPESPIARYIRKHGEGIHHIAYRVDDLEKQLKELKGKNIRLIHDEPQSGTHGTIIAFLHPESTFGVLTELCQVVD